MDVPTLGVCMAVACASVGLVLAALHGLRFWAEGTRQWAWGYAFIAASLAGIALRPVLPPLVSIVMANLVNLAGHVCLLDGIRRFTGRAPLSWEYPAVLGPAAAILAWCTFVTPSTQARIVGMTLGLAVASGLMTHALLTGRTPPGRTARSLTGTVALLLTGSLLVRVVGTVAVPPPEDFLTVSSATTCFGLAYLAFTILLPAGLILMVSEKLQGDVTVLRDLLPICSYCRRVRDDQGYWNEIEAYVRAHAGTQFSHGICPACYEATLKDLEDGTQASPGDGH